MWLFAMFDLPVTDRESRKSYTKFRRFLLNEGFHMIQFSIYIRFCENEKTSNQFRRRIERELPPSGEVRLMSVTDKQFGKMRVFFGQKSVSPEGVPDQLLLF